MKTTFSTIDEYIASFPKETQILLKKVRATIKKVAPNLAETISYAIPTFQLNGKSLVHFAGFKNHIGFYATPTGHKEFKEELANYKQGKGSVQFPLDQPIPYDLIKRIVKFRVEELTNKTKVTSKSTKQEGSLDQYLLNLKHPIKKEIEYLRKVILEANKGLTENIKWNAPNFCYEGQDRTLHFLWHPSKKDFLKFNKEKSMFGDVDKIKELDLLGIEKFAINKRK